MKYLFIDIDGTLLDSLNNKVPDSAWKAIDLAKKNGHKIFLCTGRPLSQINQFDRNDFDGVICSAGCHVEVAGKTIYERVLTDFETKQLSQLFSDLNLGYVLEGKYSNYVSKLGIKAFSGMIEEQSEQLYLEDILEMLNFVPLEHYKDDKIYKFTFYTRDKNLIKTVEKQIDNSFQLVYTDKEEGKTVEIEVIFSDCNKAEAIKKVLTYHNAILDDAIAFGDSMNDYEMIQECGVGVAMGNACKELKGISNHITTDILDDGIYNAFKELELI